MRNIARQVLKNDPDGAKLLQHLVKMYCGEAFDAASSRVTDYRLGQASVVNYLIRLTQLETQTNDDRDSSE